MILRQSFFKFFGLLFVLLPTASCSTSKETVTFSKIYEATAASGKHARALACSGDFIITGGMEGQVSIHNFDAQVMPNPYLIQIQGMEDFRDVHLQNFGSCIFMNSGKNGIIYLVARNGQLSAVYDTVGVFLDGMAFWEDGQGIVMGDPMNDKFFLARTVDNGSTWSAFTPTTMPSVLEGEAAFAGSGTGIQTIGDSTIYFVTGGGPKARLFCSFDRGENWEVKDTPMKSGGSFGIYSTYFLNEQEGFVIGGSYQDSTYNKSICMYTSNGGESWSNRSKGLLGYCSCIQGTKDGKLLVATGRMGTFYSSTKGKNWSLLTNEPFYTCNVSDTRIILLGRNGKLKAFSYAPKGK
jgi:photosystem II stability/assembly factor-like uncharacterized protein